MSVLADLDPREAASRLLAEHDDEWVSELTAELDRHLGGRRLSRVMRLWNLSRAELGDLFGVSRQAVSKWIADGVPAERAIQVADVEAVTDLLVHYLERDRIPAVVRRSATGLGGKSLMELFREGRGRDAVRLTRQMFTFTDAHR